MKELKIDRDKMLKAAESCDTVKKVFEELWPEEFEEEVHDEYGAKYDYSGDIYQIVMVCKDFHDNPKKLLVCVSDRRWASAYGGMIPRSDDDFREYLNNLIKDGSIKYIGNAF